ncbi:MAG: flagellar type III secretion system pore protein FliP [Firmicutes bacterium]|nr:flagellar type III secretion system pore protein FliP [Bacillota bacterium]
MNNALNALLQSSGSSGLPVTLLLLIAALTFLPAALVLMTSFTRIIVVLGFLRSALSVQQIPPTQVLVGLALFLTLFVMYPTATQINQVAITPYLNGQITVQQALTAAEGPLKTFMGAQTRMSDLQLFLNYNRTPTPASIQQVPLHDLVPAFALSELTTAFRMGFLLFVPFLVIDLVVAAVLMSLGMMMLPPVLVSMPFKILLFVLAGGWELVVGSLLQSFAVVTP